ncbi:MAG TPA: PAS domain S-box protein [Woeseiaceae bacterium]|nr:PAS domain S-box protein [Woeseiaceae bacterium]
MDDDHQLAAQASLAAIVESSDDAILSKDLDGIIRSCNSATERMYGYTCEELIGRPVRILIPPERQSEENDILERIRRGERIDHFETVRVAKDGRRIEVSLTISPIHDESGAIIGASKIARDISDRKRAQEQEAYLAAIISSSSDAIISKDLNGTITSANEGAERIFGYPAAELVGRPIHLLIPPERYAEEDMILRKLRAGERIDHLETVRVARDGRKLDISLSISPIRDESGKVIGVSKIARDITEQKRLARELAQQQEYFRVTLSSIGDGVIASDEEGRVTFMNPTAEELTGWLAGEAAGRPLAEVFQIINEKNRRTVENPADLVMRSGHVVGLANHTVLKHRDGSERPIADSAAPIRDKEGNPVGAVLVFRDVTEARRAEDALAEQREWFETTLESIGDAVIATDVQGRVAFMNPIAEHLTGWKLDQARGHSCAEVFNIINEESRRTVESPVTRVLAEGVIVGLANHTILIAADGTEHPIDDSGAPIRNRAGRIVGVVLVFRDIGDRRRIEAERRDVADERERLLNSERAARAEAERASRVKDEFVAMVSHELRTPLNAILGWTQLMLQSATDQDVIARGLDVISRNTRVQAQLVSDLLDVSRIASGKLRLSIEKVDLVSLVRNVIETVQQAGDSKEVGISQGYDAEAIPIAGDPARLQQIVWNLLWNAIKFTPEGGSVTVRVRTSAAGAEITVSDTGVGIKPEILPHIFERFNQAHLLGSQGVGGLGLGLSIVKHLVDLHGGTIKADSPGEGQGATFTVVLPAGAPHEVPEATAGERRRPSHPGDLLHGLRILVVEDETDTLDFLVRFLGARGAQVASASTAAEALEQLSGSETDLLISDIGLPKIDGYELLQRIRQAEAGIGGGVPAIALTAYARAEDRARAFRAGYQEHLAKPIEPADLVAAIARILQLSRRSGDADDE